MPPTVGVALIVRDEADKIERCLQSFWAHVDRVAIIDTGSTDNTRGEIMDFAHRQELAGVTTELRLGEFEWVDDFGAARRAAEDLLGDVDWRAWIDADDTIRNAAAMRELAARADAGEFPGVIAFGADYNYAQDGHGNCVCRLKRERLVKTGHGEWRDAVHEHQQLTGGVLQWVPADMLEWVHDNKTVDAAGQSSERNRRILEAWADREPVNPRVLAYLGAEHLASGDIDTALEWYDRYLKVEVQFPEERAQAHRRIALALFEKGDVEEAFAMAMQAIRVHPDWPDSYLTLAEAHYRRGEYQHAEYWARKVLERGVPDTLLIVNPLDYTLQSRIVLAGALGEQGRIAEALAIAREGLQIAPDEPRLRAAAGSWQGLTVRDEAAKRAIAMAQTLVHHDEQAKALTLLEEAVPYFAKDHPEVVTARSQLRERLLFVNDPAAYAEHYEIGGSKPEDFLDDATSLEVAARLPRARFLAGGLIDQLAA